jgi:hypothetical protein
MGYAFDIVAGQDHTDNNFGNYQYATKSGYKFHDLNADGIWDADGADDVAGTADDEVGLAGWTVCADGTCDETDADGYYELSLPPGTYAVCETLKANWYQSFPVSGHDCANGTEGYEVTLVSQGVDRGNNFGNYQYATKAGIKFEDLNANGQKDPGEPGVEGVTIRVYDTAGSLVDEATTGADGSYSFTLVPGSYLVCEFLPDPPPQWFQSYPTPETEGWGDCSAITGAAANGWAPTLRSADEDTDNHFGNYRTGSKSGYKWHDEDRDGVWDDDELGLGGWVIELWDASGYLGETTTDAEGYYEFVNLEPGDYVVCEQLPGTWGQTFPDSNYYACPEGYGLAPWGYAFTLESGEHEQTNNFGNYQHFLGFTPGFWKNHGPDAPSGNNAWRFLPTITPDLDLVGDYFAGDPTDDVLEAKPRKSDKSLGEHSLFEALSFKGGPGPAGAAQILLRAGVAALLNADLSEYLIASDQLEGYLPYPYTKQEVLDMVNAALASNDAATMLGVATDLDDTNNDAMDYFNWDWIPPT